MAPTKVRQRAVEAEIAVGRRHRWGHLHLHGGIDPQTASGGFTLSLRDPYRPLWSSAILAELEYHETHKLIDRGEQPEVAAARARHLIDRMTTAFDALVENWEPHDGTFGLPDPDDEHVVAAAVVGGASAIVTDNLRDFPMTRIPLHIKVSSPAQFAADTVAVSPELAWRALHAMASRFSAPQLTIDEILTRLVERYRMAEAADLIRAVK